MSINKQKIMQIIFNAIGSVNQLLPEESQLAASLDSVIIGNAGKLDSLSLVNLIVAIEDGVEKEFNISIDLANEGFSLDDKNPMETVGTLSDYISLLLKGRGDD